MASDRPVLLDAGPLVALLNEREQYHEWAVAQVSHLPVPFLACESVISEACFLLRKLRGGSRKVMDLLSRKLLLLPFRLDDEVTSIMRLLEKYANVPMSLADACLVRMAEQHSQAIVFTLDADFKRYRKHGRQIIPTPMPRDSQ